MINEKFVLVGATINLVGSLSYVIQTIKGKTRPNRVSWFMWALAPLIAFSAEISQGVGLRSLMTFMVGFSSAMVFIASFVNRKATWKITKLDITCGILSLIALIAWGLTSNANLAIAFAIASDLLAAIPTIVKSYSNPESEHYLVFLLGMISAIITLLTITDWTFAQYAFPLYIALCCFVLFMLIRFPWRPKTPVL
jgi:hypothetical protein